MLKLKRLKIDRYRDVEPCDLRFSDRFNVLLGPNGAGKTTLLNLISKVLWEKDRTQLDEIAKPKDEVCFRSDQNRRLAVGLAVEPVYDAMRSLHATVNAMKASVPLCRALATTHPDP